jgi:glycosyltransferase involved in cell wall biosynthesis
MVPLSTDGSISIVARTPGLESEAVEIAVTIPTFRRPDQLLRTLASIRGQRTRRNFAVIVIENDAEGRAGALASTPMIEEGSVQGLVIVAHERGNCAAYNAGWQTALVQFPSLDAVLVIDDDEIADADWLERMCAARRSFEADIVGGPQVPVFAPGGMERHASHPVFQPPYERSGPVGALYSSGNLLVSRAVLSRMGPPFLDVGFNFLGGGDSDFLSRAAAAGFRLAWCAEARIEETVPPRRLERDWIVARSLRNGVISTRVERKKRAGEALGRLRVVAKSLALLLASPVRAAMRLAEGRPPLDAIYPVHVALGRVMAEFGYAREQYREPEKN